MDNAQLVLFPDLDMSISGSLPSSRAHNSKTVRRHIRKDTTGDAFPKDPAISRRVAKFFSRMAVLAVAKFAGVLSLGTEDLARTSSSTAPPSKNLQGANQPSISDRKSVV